LPLSQPYGPDAVNLSLRIEDDRKSATVVARIVDNRYYAYKNGPGKSEFLLFFIVACSI